ncbi:MAG: hypothetical protein CMB64_05330, partial [Euryarchaeota archaeon]|nr:hypothetical protein [Euryarchaeota archaeon]
DENDIIIKVYGEINLQTAGEFHSKLLSLDKKNLDFIPVIINSGGGEVDALMMMVSSIEQCSTAVCTICAGICASSAAVLFCFGSENLRIMYPNSHLMFHEFSMSCGESKGCDIRATHSHYTKIDKVINKKIEAHCSLPNNFFDEMSHVDTFIPAKEAYKFGLCSFVGYPSLKIECKFKMSLDLKKGVRQETEKRPYKYQKIMPLSVDPVIQVTS